MSRPPYKQPRGIYKSLDNRFEFDFEKNPSPMRAMSGDLQRQTEGIPLVCSWCSGVFWPPMNICQGLCSEACTQEEQAYTQERTERDQLLEALREQEADLNRLRAMDGKEVVV